MSAKKWWSSTLWNEEKTLINWRWYSPQSESADYSSPYQIQIFLMTQEELAQLAPAEKFDIFLGRYDFPLKEEASSVKDENLDDLYAWQLASLYHEEPQAKLVVNSDGLSIPFGSSDIKALLSYHYSFNQPTIGDSMGLREELDAGTFHVTLANKLGKMGEVFFIDVDPKERRENRLVIKFQSMTLDEFKPQGNEVEGTAKVLKILNRLTYLDSSPLPTWEASGVKHLVMEYSYHLYLNLKDEVIGGKWLTSERPESLWILEERVDFNGLLQGLDLLLEK